MNDLEKNAMAAVQAKLQGASTGLQGQRHAMPRFIESCFLLQKAAESVPSSIAIAATSH